MSQKLRLLLMGKTGQLGADLERLLQPDWNVVATDRTQIDLCDLGETRRAIRAADARVIVNAAAYTAVDRAENDRKTATAINATAPRVIAEEARRSGALLIHYSTDYVFDGRKAEPYVEADEIGPLSVYGSTKAEGENAIRESDCDHLIFRTSWVFSDRGSNFLLTMLRLSEQQNELRIVDDQIGSPTSSIAIARATAEILRKATVAPGLASDVRGTYHMSSSGYASWYEFANRIFEFAKVHGVAAPKVMPVPTSEFQRPARRPLNSRLNCCKLQSVFGITMPEWQAQVRSVLDVVLGGNVVDQKIGH